MLADKRRRDSFIDTLTHEEYSSHPPKQRKTPERGFRLYCERNLSNVLHQLNTSVHPTV